MDEGQTGAMPAEPAAPRAPETSARPTESAAAAASGAVAAGGGSSQSPKPSKGSQGQCSHDASDSEDDDEEYGGRIMEVHGEWEKRDRKVHMNETPGVDRACLAMDTQTGIEAVWHEVDFKFHDRTTRQSALEIRNMSQMFERLMRLDHPNIVNFKDYWIDYRERKSPTQDSQTIVDPTTNVHTHHSSGSNQNTVSSLQDVVDGTTSPDITPDVESVRDADKPVPYVGEESTSSSSVSLDSKGRKKGCLWQPLEWKEEENNTIEGLIKTLAELKGGGREIVFRLVFITESMSQGTLAEFFSDGNGSPKPATIQRWCKQILMAIDYLHSCRPPIVHANLSCDTIFRHHNGQLKIGSIALDIIRTSLASKRGIGQPGDARDLHSPDIASPTEMNPQQVHEQSVNNAASSSASTSSTQQPTTSALPTFSASSQKVQNAPVSTTSSSSATTLQSGQQASATAPAVPPSSSSSSATANGAVHHNAAIAIPLVSSTATTAASKQVQNRVTPEGASNVSSSSPAILNQPPPTTSTTTPAMSIPASTTGVSTSNDASAAPVVVLSSEAKIRQQKIEQQKRSDIYDFGIAALLMHKADLIRDPVKYQKVRPPVDSKFLREQLKFRKNTKEQRVSRPMQSFIRKCTGMLKGKDSATGRPTYTWALSDQCQPTTASELLRDKALFEISPLKPLAAHALIECTEGLSDVTWEDILERLREPKNDVVIFEIRGKVDEGGQPYTDKWTYRKLVERFKDLDKREDLNLQKYLEDVRSGQHGPQVRNYHRIPNDAQQEDAEEEPPATDRFGHDVVSQPAADSMTHSYYGDIAGPGSVGEEEPLNHVNAEQAEKVRAANLPVHLADPGRDPCVDPKYDEEVRMIKDCSIMIRKTPNNGPHTTDSVSSQASDTASINLPNGSLEQPHLDNNNNSTVTTTPKKKAVETSESSPTPTLPILSREHLGDSQAPSPAPSTVEMNGVDLAESLSPFVVDITLFFPGCERKLTATIQRRDKGMDVARELVFFGFLNVKDMKRVSTIFNHAKMTAFGQRRGTELVEQYQDAQLAEERDIEARTIVPSAESGSSGITVTAPTGQQSVT